MNRDRTSVWIDRLLKAYGFAAYAFLFLPILVVIVFSFNAGRHVAELTGFSLQWYVKAWTDPFVVRAFWTSISIALTAGLISTVLGTGAAIAMPSLPGWIRRSFDMLVNVAIVVPGIVLGLSLLIFVVTATGWLNDWIAYLFPGSGFRLGLGFHSVVAGHSIFGTAIVAILVRTRLASLDPEVIEVSGDLYARPTRTLFKVTLPLLAPAILAGFLLAFTFSFDDFIIAFFTRGQAQTIPIFLFSSIRRGVSPVINATASSLLAISITLMTLASLLYRRRGHQTARS
ncbi:MAG: ABC transporter permease [Acidimicrobiia bacterium]